MITTIIMIAMVIRFFDKIFATGHQITEFHSLLAQSAKSSVITEVWILTLFFIFSYFWIKYMITTSSQHDYRTARRAAWRTTSRWSKSDNPSSTAVTSMSGSFFIFTFFAAKLPFKFLSSYLLRTLLEFLVALLLSGWLAVYGFIIEVLPLLLDHTSLPPKIGDLEDKNLCLFNKIFVTTGRPSDLLQRPCGYVRVLRGSHTILSVSGFDLDV